MAPTRKTNRHEHQGSLPPAPDPRKVWLKVGLALLMTPFVLILMVLVLWAVLATVAYVIFTVGQATGRS